MFFLKKPSLVKLNFLKFKHFSFSFKLMLIQVVLFCLSCSFSCQFSDTAAGHLFSNAQTIGCSYANIHSNYYFIFMIVTD